MSAVTSLEVAILTKKDDELINFECARLEKFFRIPAGYAVSYEAVVQ